MNSKKEESCSERHRNLEVWIKKYCKSKEFETYTGDDGSYDSMIDLGFNRLYDESLKEGFYWKFCPFKVWIENIENQKEEFFKRFVDAGELDFWDQLRKSQGIRYVAKFISEIEWSEFKVERYDREHEGWFYYPFELKIVLSEDTYNKVVFSEKKKREYIDKKIAELEPTKKLPSTQLEVAEKKIKIGGKELELAERYLIVNELIDIHSLLSKIDTSQGNRNNILAILMGCNVDNAKHLFNGTYRPYSNISDERKTELMKYAKDLES